MCVCVYIYMYIYVYIYEKHLMGKGKYIVKVGDQPLKNLVWRLKDKSSKIKYKYNK